MSNLQHFCRGLRDGYHRRGGPFLTMGESSVTETVWCFGAGIGDMIASLTGKP